jgi:hypothetical protein
MRILESGLAVGILLVLTACNRGPSGAPYKDESSSNVRDAADNGGSVGHYSHVFGKQFQVIVPYAALDKAPKWTEADENPPLSAKKALKAANKMKDSLVKDNDKFKWSLHSLALTPARGDRWYWMAEYRAHVRRGGSSGPPRSLRLVVLMDGKAIQPKVSDDK